MCLRPFGHLLDGRELVFGDMESNYKHPSPHFQYIQNSFLYSLPGHPFWLEMVHRIADTPRNENGRPEYVTGPQAMMRLLVDRWDNYVRDLTIYPGRFFNPFSWITRADTPCLDLNQMSDNRLRDCIAHHKKNGSYVLQLHTHSWGADTIHK